MENLSDEAWVKDEARYPDAVAFQSGPRDKPEWRIVSPAVGIRYGNGVLGEPMRMFDTPAEAWVDTRRRLEAADASWIKQAAEREDGAFVSVGGLITDLESASTAAEPVQKPKRKCGCGSGVDWNGPAPTCSDTGYPPERCPDALRKARKAEPVLGESELPALNAIMPDAPEVHESEGYSPSNRTYKWKWVYADEFDEYEQGCVDLIADRDGQLGSALAMQAKYAAMMKQLENELEMFSGGAIDPDCEEEDCTYCSPYRNARAVLAAYREMGLGK